MSLCNASIKLCLFSSKNLIKDFNCVFLNATFFVTFCPKAILAFNIAYKKYRKLILEINFRN